VLLHGILRYEQLRSHDFWMALPTADDRGPQKRNSNLRASLPVEGLLGFLCAEAVLLPIRYLKLSGTALQHYTLNRCKLSICVERVKPP
jgi:hypothetical protein